MQYLGGKARGGREIGAYLSLVAAGKPYVEPFCGALNVTAHVHGASSRLAADMCLPLIVLYESVAAGWTPKLPVTEEDYRQVKERMSPTDPMTAFVGFGCSFGGKWFGGYARGDGGKDGYAIMAWRSLSRKMRGCRRVDFRHADYRELMIPEGAVVYCDPPYAGTTGYAGIPDWDAAEFWVWATELSEWCTVLVSEYTAPEAWEAVWEWQGLKAMNAESVAERAARPTEKVYRLRSAPRTATRVGPPRRVA